MAFTHYDSIPVPTLPTTQEIIASLTGGQKTAVLNGFAKNVGSITLARRVHIAENAVAHLYAKLDEIEEMSRRLMRGEVVITPAVVDPETGEVITPAVYNTPPGTITALRTAVASSFVDEFTSPQVSAILNKMVQYSKHDGSGDWTFYKNNVIL